MKLDPKKSALLTLDDSIVRPEELVVNKQRVDAFVAEQGGVIESE